MKALQSNWFPVVLMLLCGIVVVNKVTTPLSRQGPYVSPSYDSHTNEWIPPDESTLPYTEEGDLIRYGKELIANTSFYLGPKGVVAPISNGMNCQNCHINAGKEIFGNCFSAVASTYPRYRDRSGVVESIEFRINDCLIRSLNGKKIDSLSREMRAMVRYFEWLGKDVPKDVKPKGAGVEPIGFISRAADPQKGKKIFLEKCQRCHGPDGEGVYNQDSTAFVYPPLWGPNSYNTGAGLYRLSHFAAFVKNNMPFGTTYLNPVLTDEEAWDVAAFVNSQPRPQKNFSSDWPDISKKPVDHPLGPHPDGFSETQHKYGPFEPIKKQREKKQK